MATPESIKLLQKSNETNIPALIAHYAKSNPNDIAMTCESLSITYGELNDKANQFAQRLQNMGVAHEQFVAIALDRSIEMLISIFGILKAGGAYLPLDYSQPENRLLTLLTDSKTNVLITKSSLKEKFASYKGIFILLDEDVEKTSQHPIILTEHLLKPESLAYLLYTSGSTGKPKGVLIEHQSVINYIFWLAQYARLRPQQRIDFSTNFIFDMAVTTSIAALVLGLEVVICSDHVKKNVSHYLQWLREKKINIIKLTPSFFKILLEEVIDDQIELTELQIIILGGENLNTEECKRWLEIYPNHILFNEYGPTETTVAVSQFEITSKTIKTLTDKVPIGKPGIGVDFTILAEDGSPTPYGMIGELHIGGRCLARGYLNQKELTQKRFISTEHHQTLYKTGDLCRYLPDGNLLYLGRIDDQVKIRGFRIELCEIETCLKAHPSIKEASVLVHNDHLGEKKLIAYYIPKKLHAPHASELREFLCQHLANYMIPSLFIMREFFPLTQNGKLDKQLLLSEPFVIERQTTLARTQLEQQLVEIWSEIFNNKCIGIDDNFFELGGHSLIAARIISKIGKKIGKRITLQELHQAPTIRTLAVIIADAKLEKAQLLFFNSHSKNRQTVPLSDFQFMFWMSSLVEKKVKKNNIVARKRVAGRLNISMLQHAFALIFNNNEILTYRIFKLFPAQKNRKKIAFNLIEKDISNLSAQNQESELLDSLDHLRQFHCWQQKSVNVIAKLFYLADDQTEIQIGMPHIIADDASIYILFDYLSQYYLQPLQAKQPSQSAPYKHFIEFENNYTRLNIDRDIQFWENDLKDCDLVTFPAAEIIEDMESRSIPYSSFFELSESWIQNLQQVGAEQKISTTDILCAAIIIGLQNYSVKNQKKMFINIIKSTRDDEIFDKTIGCFIRLDALKIDTYDNEHLFDLAKRIQKYRLDSAPYQGCPSMVKLACLNTSQHWPRLKTLIKSVIVTYTKLFRFLRLNPKVLMMYLRLAALRKKPKFLVTINIFNNFFHSKNNNTHWCGLKLQSVKTHQYDLSNINNVLDISFLKDENNESAYLVITANLQTSLRTQLGNAIIDHIPSVCTKKFVYDKLNNNAII